MRKFLSLLVGMGVGAAIGALLAIFFSPVSAEEFQANLQRHYQRALQAGRAASVKRRAELEQELGELRNKPPAD